MPLISMAARFAHRLRGGASDALDDLFLQHYASLVARARQLVRDRQAAEDLVHDAYVRLALRDFDPRTVENIHAYLFATLRNVYLSQVRRQQDTLAKTASIVDHESAIAGLRSSATEEERQQAYEVLRQAAYYACLRKATSTAASVLILRFFHGYYPREIARVVRATEAAVTERLRVARAEVRSYLAEPDRLRGFGKVLPLQLATETDGDSASILALQRIIFDARRGACVTERALDCLYTGSDALDVTTLAHLVSCAGCLDAVNHRLGLPLLADRDPWDRLGRNGPTDAGGGSGSGKTDLARMLRKRLEDARQDHPHILRVAANGLFVGSQAINGSMNQQSVKVLIAEPLAFIEAFDHRGTCLLYLDVELPPSGLAEQSTHVTLSDDRRLSATVGFSDASPTVHVAYLNPSPVVARQAVIESAERTAGVRTYWPLALQFVLAGLILGALLANPRQTLAAADQMRRLVLDAIERLIETVRPRAVLLSRPVTPPAQAGTLVAPVATVGVRVPTAVPVIAGAPSALQLSELTVEALRLLESAGALTREQIGVERGEDRRLHIAGIVQTEGRRRELAAVLRSLPARHVRVELVTIEEAARRAGAIPAGTRGLARSAEVNRGGKPAAHEHIRGYLLASADAGSKSPPEASDARASDAARQLSADILSRSLQMRAWSNPADARLRRVSGRGRAAIRVGARGVASIDRQVRGAAGSGDFLAPPHARADLLAADGGRWRRCWWRHGGRCVGDGDASIRPCVRARPDSAPGIRGGDGRQRVARRQ